MSQNDFVEAMHSTFESLSEFYTHYEEAVKAGDTHAQREAVIDYVASVPENALDIAESLNVNVSKIQEKALNNATVASRAVGYVNKLKDSYYNSSEKQFMRDLVVGLAGVVSDEAERFTEAAYDATNIEGIMGFSDDRTMADNVNYLLDKDSGDYKDLATKWLTPDVLERIDRLSKKVDQMDSFTREDWERWKKEFGINRDGNYYNYDPLVLDLDGDGIEITDLNDQSSIYFDHDNDGIKTATSWLNSDDGFLVMDRNDDGLINNGSELFGDSTPSDGGDIFENGFQALASLDNDKNGIIDSNDISFDNLKIWRDINNDGISQSDELFSLEDYGIKSINLSYSLNSKTLIGTNVEKEKGTYINTSGDIHTISDINFSFDSFYSQYTDEVVLTEEQKKQINLSGHGYLRDLRDSAAESQKLNELLNNYKAANTKEEQIQLISELVTAWAKTSPYYSESINVLPADHKTNSSGTAIKGSSTKPEDLSDTPELLNIIENLIDKIAVIDAFSGKGGNIYYTSKSDLENISETIKKCYIDLLENIYHSLSYETRLSSYYDALSFNSDFSINLNGMILMIEENFQKDPLNTFIDLGEIISIEEKNITFEPLFDLFHSYCQFAFDNNKLASWSDALGGYSLGKLGAITGSIGTDKLDGTSSRDYLYSSLGDDILNGGAGDDILYGGAGNDSLSGDAGDDIYLFRSGHGQDTITESTASDANTLVFEGAIFEQVILKKSGNDLIIVAYGEDDSVTLKNFFNNSANYRQFSLVFDNKTFSIDEVAAIDVSIYGTDGNDTLSGWNNGDTLYGYAGNDALNGNNGNDTLDGGTGNDKLYGGSGDDTYVFNKGHGHDTVSDSSSAAINTLVFQGATAADLTLQKSGYDLIIHAYGTDDTVTLPDYFRSASYQRFSIALDDQTLSMDDLTAMGFPVYGTDGNDTLSGWNNGDTLYGYAGNDSLNGNNGNDTLDGGTGNDKLSGGSGDDTYVFNKGHGHDTVSDSSSAAINTLVFQGATAADLSLQKSGYDLIIHAYGSEDTVTLTNYFNSASYRRFEIKLQDQTIDLSELEEFVSDKLAKQNVSASLSEIVIEDGEETLSNPLHLSSLLSEETDKGNQTKIQETGRFAESAELTSQVNLLIHAMATFGDNSGASGLSLTPNVIDYNNHNILAIPQ